MKVRLCKLNRSTHLGRASVPRFTYKLREFSSSPSTRNDTTPVDLKFDHHIPPNGNERQNPLLILHGLFGSKRNWQSLSKAFARELNRPVFALDLRNQGSSPHAAPMTYEAMASDVLHFCELQNLSDVSLLGHSMGGKVAMAVALAPDLPPSLLSRLIIADIAPSKGQLSSDFVSYVQAMQRIDAEGVQTRKEAEAVLIECEKDPAVRAFLLTNFTPSSPSNSSHTRSNFRVPLALLSDAIPNLGSFPYDPGEPTWYGKTMFVKGALSRYINDKNLHLAKAFFPNMILESLHASHWVHAEQWVFLLFIIPWFDLKDLSRPQEFKRVVVDFVLEPEGGDTMRS